MAFYSRIQGIERGVVYSPPPLETKPDSKGAPSLRDSKGDGFYSSLLLLCFTTPLGYHKCTLSCSILYFALRRYPQAVHYLLSYVYKLQRESVLDGVLYLSQAMCNCTGLCPLLHILVLLFTTSAYYRYHLSFCTTVLYCYVWIMFTTATHW